MCIRDRSTTYKYTSKKENPPTNRGLFHDFRFSPGYDNLQQDGISEAVGSLTVFLHTAGKGASCPYCGHFRGRPAPRRARGHGRGAVRVHPAHHYVVQRYQEAR